MKKVSKKKKPTRRCTGIVGIKDLASFVAKQEGTKSSVSIGDVREILGILSDLQLFSGGQVGELLMKSGQTRRTKLRKKLAMYRMAA